MEEPEVSKPEAQRKVELINYVNENKEGINGNNDQF